MKHFSPADNISSLVMSSPGIHSPPHSEHDCSLTSATRPQLAHTRVYFAPQDGQRSVAISSPAPQSSQFNYIHLSFHAAHAESNADWSRTIFRSKLSQSGCAVNPWGTLESACKICYTENIRKGVMYVDILFVGNSHSFFNDMPRTFSILWQALTGEKVRPIMLCHGGMGFSYHLKEYFELRYDLLYGGFTYAVFQQKAHPFAGSEEEFEAGVRLAELSRRGGAIPVFALTWAEKANPEHQDEMDRFHLRLCSETGSLLSPVGHVWQTLLAEEPEFPLYFSDGQHASVYGDYLIAATHCRLLSGKSVLSLPSVGCDFFDPEKQKIKEDPKSCEIQLDESLCRRILTAVDRVFSAKGG